MTVIVGYKDKDGIIYMGSDSGTFNNWLVHTESVEKLFKKENNGDKMIFGVCGDVRFSQLIQYHFKIPDRPSNMKDDIEYLVSVFAESLNNCLKDQLKSQLKDNVLVHDGSFLLGYNKNLYKICCDLSVLKSSWNYDADGAGIEFALGALHVLEKDKSNTPQDIVLGALDAANKYSAAVAPPFKVITLE